MSFFSSFTFRDRKGKGFWKKVSNWEEKGRFWELQKLFQSLVMRSSIFSWDHSLLLRFVVEWVMKWLPWLSPNLRLTLPKEGALKAPPDKNRLFGTFLWSKWPKQIDFSQISMAMPPIGVSKWPKSGFL